MPARPTASAYDALLFGGGLAGSLLAHELSERGQRVLLVDDPERSRCSRVAAGLINPIGGQRLKLAWMADTLIPFATRRYEELESRLGQRFFHPRPLARLFSNPEEEAAWTENASDPAYQPWVADLQSLALPADFASDRGFAVRHAGYLDTNALLDALRPALDLIRSSFHYEEIGLHPNGVSWRDHVARRAVFCEGHLATGNPWFGFVPYKPAKGVIGRARIDAPLPETAILKGKFLIPRHDGLCHVGATYRWDDPTDEPDPTGIQELEQFLRERFGERWRWESVAAGVRPATAGAKPVIGPHPERDRLIAFNGFGSKGSMQIPYFAKRLADYLLDGTPLPAEVLPARFVKKSKAEPLRWRATEVARERVLGILRPGDLAIDATAGNGHDTLWLCQAVGPSGRVFGFDVQEQAIQQTRARISGAGLSDRLTLIHAGHETLAEAIPESARGKVAAIAFNLGYLPGGDKSLVTRPATTLAALDASIQILKPGGILSVVVYPAHAGGGEETEAALEWLKELSPVSFSVEILSHPNGHPASPFPLLIVRR